MKKMALLLTILCAGALNGMQEWYNLPNELKQEIINTALAASNNIDAATKAIKTTGALYGVKFDENNLEDFTTLVHILANRFNLPTKTIAEQFNSPTAKQYLDLGMKMSNPAMMTAPYIALLISKGADVNFSTFQFPNSFRWDNDFIEKPIVTLLMRAMNEFNVEAVKTLLDAGANQNLLYPLKGTALDYLHHVVMFKGYLSTTSQNVIDSSEKKKAEEIEQLLKNAMKK